MPSRIILPSASSARMRVLAKTGVHYMHVEGFGVSIWTGPPLGTTMQCQHTVTCYIKVSTATDIQKFFESSF